MSTAELRTPLGPWNALSWKWMRQIVPLHALLFGLLFAMVLLNSVLPRSGLTRIYLSDESLILFWFAIPFISAVLSAAITYGLEREAGSWDWHTTLPISWRYLLFFHFVAATGLVLVELVVAQPFLYAVTNERLSNEVYGYFGLYFPFWDWASFLLALLCWMQTYCLMSIAILLVGDLLKGLTVGASLALLVQWLMPSVFANGLTAVNFIRGETALVPEAILVSLVLQLFLVATMVGVFAWRWSNDLKLETVNWWRLVVPSPREALPTEWSDKLSIKNTNSFWALLWCTFEQYKFVRLGLLVLAIIGSIVVLNEIDSARPHFFYVMISGYATVLLGVSVFSSDQTRSRFRFLSHRGVSPGLFWLTHQIWPGIIVLFFCLVYSAKRIQTPPSLDEILTIGPVLIVAMYSLAQLTSIAFRHFILAIIWWCLTMIGLAIAYGRGCELFPQFWIFGSHESVLPIVQSLIVLFISCQVLSYWYCRRLFLLEQPRLGWRMIGVSIAGVVVAFALGASLTYLQIPKTKWIGLQANDIPVIVDRLGLSTNTPAVTVKIDDLLMDNKLWANLRECVANDADEANAELRGEVSKQLDQYFDRVAKRFDENPRSIPFNPSTTNDLSNLNSQLSFALLFLSLEKNFDRMTQCLKLLGKMRSTDLSKAGLQLALLNTSTQILTKDFVDAVGGSNAVRDLVRPLYLNAVEAEQLTVDLMTLVRFGTDDQLDCADRVLAPSHLKNYYQRRNSNYWNPDSVRTTVLSLSLQNKVSGVSMSQYAWELEQAKLAEREMPKWFLGNLNRPMSQNFEEDLANQYPIIMHTVWSISYSASEWEYGINHELRNVESTDQSSAATNSQLEVEQ